MKCNHRQERQEPSYICDYTGEVVDGRWYEQGTYEDISVGAFKCTQCGEIGYYTGLWKNYYENGIPCPGSKNVERNLK